jgi:hypothetical protein
MVLEMAVLVLPLLFLVLLLHTLAVEEAVQMCLAQITAVLEV